MHEPIRKSGLNIIGGILWGSHFCQFYRTKKDLVDILVPYFQAGLENNEFCMWVTPDELTRENARKTMTKALPAFSEYENKGQIEIITCAEWYLKDSQFDSKRVLKSLVRKLNWALKKGYQGLRLADNTFWLEKKHRRDFAGYEQAVDKVIGKHKIIAICAYPLAKYTAAEIIDVINNHGFAMVKHDGKWGIVETSSCDNTKGALGESEKRFRQAFHSSPVALSISSIDDGTFVDVNQSFLQLFGYQRSELIGKSAAGLNLYEDPAVRAEIVRQLEQAGKIVNLEVSARAKNGIEIKALTSAEIIEVNGRNQIVWTTIDITDRKITEDRLKESEERFSRAFYSSPLGLVITTLPDGRFVDANDSFLRLTEYDREDVIGLTSAEVNLFTNPHDREKVWHTLLEKGSFKNVEMTWRTKTGKVINVISSNERFSLHGRHHAIFMMLDITERKKAENEVILLNRELRAITECDQIIVHAANENTLFSDICHTMCTTAGYRLAWVGLVEQNAIKSVRPVAWCGNEEYVFNLNITWGDLPRGRGPSGLAARTGKTHYFQDFTLAPAAAPWREAAVKLGYRSSVALPLFDSAGVVFGVFTLYSSEPNYFNPNEIRLLEELAGDISFGIDALREKSERVKAEKSLRETTDYLNNLFDYANAPIIVWDPYLNITRFNHAFERLTGLKTSEVLGKPLDILFPEDSKAESLRYINRTTSGERWETVEIYIQNKHGEKHIVLWNSATLFDVDGNRMVATIAQGQDITERKKAEDEVRLLNEELKRRAAELEASNKELEAFSYSVSHDLRAPLRSITGFSSVLLEDYHDKLDEEGKSYLRKIQDSGELMGQLIDDLLRLSRVTRSDTYYEKVNLTDLAQNVVDDLAKSEPTRQVKVTIAPDIIAYGDRNLLHLVVQNLLGNAWKYTGKTAEPFIEMGTLPYEGKAAYFVRDNGVGFDMTYSQKLFQPFQRLHRASEFTGTGIGLATVQRIVRRHGGKVWAESKVGEGATFYFTLN